MIFSPLLCVGVFLRPCIYRVHVRVMQRKYCTVVCNNIYAMQNTVSIKALFLFCLHCNCFICKQNTTSTVAVVYGLASGLIPR